MVKIITFEGPDYSGKTTTSKYLVEKMGGRYGLCYNDGLIYPTDVSLDVCQVAESANDLVREVLYTTAFMTPPILRKCG